LTVKLRLKGILMSELLQSAEIPEGVVRDQRSPLLDHPLHPEWEGLEIPFVRGRGMYPYAQDSDEERLVSEAWVQMPSIPADEYDENGEQFYWSADRRSCEYYAVALQAVMTHRARLRSRSSGLCTHGVVSGDLTAQPTTQFGRIICSSGSTS